MVKAMGLVFGDIGTSPIYTLSVIFLTVNPTPKNVAGILSLVLWTLILLVTLQYAVFAMSLSRRGEGGAIVLNEILKKLARSSRSTIFFSYLTFLGVSLLMGDSVITPAISILSAVEGLELVVSEISQGWILAIAAVIAVFLFAIQRKGVEKVAQVFGPIMLLWFVALGTSGVVSIFKSGNFGILGAFSPLCAVDFLKDNGLAGFFILSQVILCATGAEALYADMGHLGRKPIVRAWYFVFIMLALNYLGQGAYILSHPDVKNIIFSMFFSQAPFFYVPFLILSVLATIIASQAMISGLFSVIYQAINVHVLPPLKINFTSEKLKGQIYIDAVNWLLMAFVLIVMFAFKKSSALAAAYGFAVSGAISVTALMIGTIFFLKRKYFQAFAALGLLVLDLAFFGSCLSKMQHGAYWSVILASIPLFVIVLYTNGSRVLYSRMSPLSREHFLEKYRLTYKGLGKINGTALFFTKGMQKISPYVVNTMFINNIIYTDNVFVNINQTNDPHGVSWGVEKVEEGLRVLKINAGYMEVLDIPKILKTAGISEKAIFYGVDDIESQNPFWVIFSKIKKLTPSYMQFYKLPSHKVHGVLTHVQM